MHSIDPYADRLAPRSNLVAALRRLRGHAEKNRQREQVAMEQFGSLHRSWADHHHSIAERLDWLDQQFSQFALSALPVPPLSLLNLSNSTEECAESLDCEQDVESFATDDEYTDGIISPRGVPWNQA